MDIDGLLEVLGRIEGGEIRLHAKDTTEPSPFSHEMLNSKPYTYLDNAPLEERRARAVTLRRTLPESARDLGALDPEAIERVREEARPQPRDPEEVHDALLGLIAVRAEDAGDWASWLDELAVAGRAAVATTTDGDRLWFAAENVRLVEGLYSGGRISPELRLPAGVAVELGEEEALLALVRGHLEYLGPVTVEGLAMRVLVTPGRVASALAQLEGQGLVLRGRFTLGTDAEEFCDRRLLARIHRYTLDRLRQEIEPVSVQDFLRFLLRWQHLAPGTQLEGRRGLFEAVVQLQGFEVPAVAWERHILPARVAAYRGSWLDELCLSGDVAWARYTQRRPANGNGGGPSAASSATPVSLARRIDVPWLLAGIRPDGRPCGSSESASDGGAPVQPLKGAARDLLELLQSSGALFYEDLVRASGRLPTDVERGLWELVARGLVTADGFQALRSLMGNARRRSFRQPRRARLFRTLAVGTPSGRWALLPALDEQMAAEELAEAWAEQLLSRYGVLFRDLMQRENVAIPWRDILRALRRMEARGAIRGGRFVGGIYGEQYARPEAVESLRRVRRTEKRGETVRVSAVDPLNLAGIITPGARITAVHTKAVVFRDGLPVIDADGGVIPEPSVAGASTG